MVVQVVRVITILSLVLGLLTSCTKKNTDLGLSVLKRVLSDDIKSLDPANAYDSISLDIVPAIYDTLYQFEYLSYTYKAVPLLAEAYPAYSKDRLTVTFKIQKGIRFQDDPCFKQTGGKGRELKASDFVYAFKRLAHPAIESQGYWIFDGKVVGFTEFHDKLAKATSEKASKLFEEPIEGIKALDDYALQIKLVRPYPQLLYILSMGFTTPIPIEAIQVYGDEKGNITEHAVGTGPYILKEWKRHNRIILERNPTYHTELYPKFASPEFQKKGYLVDAGKKLPFIDKIIISIVKEEQPTWLGFLKGDYDLMGIPKDNFRQAIMNQVNLSPEFSSRGIHLMIEP
ncbi:MAG: hypothetical protein HY072_01470, partial [Deltaproteobacteria bacterium]|nr:hypothetical protein [Deltaproteobacteria bacterium]